MPFSTSLVDVTQAIKDKLVAASGLGLTVYYGREELIPTFPAATVEGVRMTRSLRDGQTHRWELVFLLNITIWHGKVQSGEVNEKEAEQKAEAVTTELHTDKSLGGRVIFGYVTQMEPGILARGEVMLRATRLTWEAISREDF